MKAIILKRVSVCTIAVAILACTAGTMSAQQRAHVKLNEKASAFAVQLVKHGRFIADGKGAWANDRPSTELENDFVRHHGFDEYAKWHLGIDDRYPENTKRRYKFPYGDFKNVHRCGLLAVKIRASRYGYTEVESAASKLIEMMTQ